jgi:phosphatidylserine/phosphatidylglycerophosphate/cardiolipin synthase-like enzyme
MAAVSEFTPSKHVTPIRSGELTCKVTSPWFVDCSEYTPKFASFKTLVNGQEAFGDVYRAIERAKKSVSIVCWGFQPSMYFIRDGQHLMIGELLEKKAREGVMVRVLGWIWSNKPLAGGNYALQTIEEQNAPGRRMMPGLKNRPDSSSDRQQAYDVWWYSHFDRNPTAHPVADTLLSPSHTVGRFMRGSGDLPTQNLRFYSRAFGALDSVKIAGTNFYDEGMAPETKGYVSAFTSHHQKTVVVDHEDPSLAVAFVMGHNMLDGYWDTPEHSFQRHPEHAGRNGMRPLHDYSSKVTGPIVGDVFSNFAVAWEKQTGETIPVPEFKAYPIRGLSEKAFCQILRTQPQHDRYDIMKCYLQAANNATQYIHIENQYFRWPPLAELIKASAAKMAQWGRTPERDGNLYLFVITNSTDAGMGVGTENTSRMLESLGRADRIPQVTRNRRLNAVDEKIKTNQDATKTALSQRKAIDEQVRLLPPGAPGLNARYEPVNARLAALEAEKKQLDAQRQALANDVKAETIAPMTLPGLKTHIATLVAPDTPAGQPWPEVYIHAKLMLIDDAFMTLGSANINTRSMQADSEMNIAHHRPEITRPLREQQWAKYTNGMVTAGMSFYKAFGVWQDLMNKNSANKKLSLRPVAQLAEFLRDSPVMTNKD